VRAKLRFLEHEKITTLPYVSYVICQIVTHLRACGEDERLNSHARAIAIEIASAFRHRFGDAVDGASYCNLAGMFAPLPVARFGWVADEDEKTALRTNLTNFFVKEVARRARAHDAQAAGALQNDDDSDEDEVSRALRHARDFADNNNRFEDTLFTLARNAALVCAHYGRTPDAASRLEAHIKQDPDESSRNARHSDYLLEFWSLVEAHGKNRTTESPFDGMHNKDFGMLVEFYFYPGVSETLKALFATQASSAASERVFSAAKFIAAGRNLSSSTLESLTVYRNFIRAVGGHSVAAYIATLEKIALEIRSFKGS